MSHQLFQLPKQTNIDSSVRVTPGAKAYFYATTTTTPQDTYTTSARNVAHQNPVVADGNGVFPQIYLDPALVYKLTLNTSADVLIYTVDPVNDQVLSTEDLGAYLYPRSAAEISEAVVPVNLQFSYGDAARNDADESGTTDSKSAIDDAAIAYPIAKFTVPGTYSVSPLTLPAVRLEGMGFTSDVLNPAHTSLTKRSNGVHVTLDGQDASIESIDLNGRDGSGITGDGLQVAADRQIVRHVSVHDQGSDGIRIGGAGASGVFNANLWYLERPISFSNTGDGVYIHHSGGTITGTYPAGIPDCNAGLMLGGDLRINGSRGLVLENTIDNVFVGVVVQDNVGKGVELRDGARGHKFFGLYAEGNNLADGLPGSEVDILSGATENAIIGLRSNQTTGAGLRDVNTPGKNLLMHYDAGIGSWVYRAKFALWNPFQDGSTTTDFECWCDLDPTSVHVWTMKGAITGTSGGVWSVYTKRDGDTEVLALFADHLQRTRLNGALREVSATVTYSASMTPDAALANDFEITANNGTAFTINAPTNPLFGQRITFAIRNTSGGALGAVTWDAVFKLAAWTSPATGNSRAITFLYNGSNWVERSRTPADVPN